MKTIYLLRHAEAEHDINNDDFCRTLSENGCRQARTLGKTLKEKHIAPELIYCSPSYRTLQTLEELKLNTPSNKVVFAKELYEAPEDVYLEMLEKLDKDTKSVMFVGHNPGIFSLALSLTELCGTEDIFSYAPCTFTIFENQDIKWENMRKRCFSLKETIRPDVA